MTNNQGNEGSSDLQTTTEEVGGVKITISLADVQAMKVALVDYLTAADAAAVGDRDYLLTWTKPARARIDHEGAARIGPWVLQVRDVDLVLAYRLPAPEDPMVLVNYVATLAHEDSWQVVRVEPERIRRRR
jgi:hypothetical protein